MDPLKMYLLLKMVLFHGYVSSPEGMYRKLKRVEIGFKEMHLFRASLRFFFALLQEHTAFVKEVTEEKEAQWPQFASPL